MANKLHVGLLFGGLSTEHEVSILSARNIYKSIDTSKYDVSLIRIDKRGYWYLSSTSNLLNAADNANADIANPEAEDKVFLSPARNAGQLLKLDENVDDKSLTQVSDDIITNRIDVIFPVLHGTNGEDGTIQGLLKLVNIPFVGAGVVGSALGMDKDVMKRLLKEAGLPIPKFMVVRRPHIQDVTFADVQETLGLPFFIKPANAGSSVGISKISTPDEFKSGLDNAFKYDNKVLIEETVRGREIECAVIGNEHPIASITGEIITQHSFYSYDAKYLDETGTVLQIPAQIPATVSDHIRDLSLKAYQALCCEGMARVDFFMKEDHEVLINELNTIPGFTERSMFPVLWEHSGIRSSELVDKLIALALERHERDKRLQTTR